MRLSIACLAIVAAAAAALLAPAIAAACSSAPPSAAIAIPRTGATDVPTQTSLIVVSQTQPSELRLTAGGADVPLDGVTLLGGGIDGADGTTQFWRVRILPGTSQTPLAPSSEHVLSMASPTGGARVTLTTFTTAAGYDKQPGLAAAWRNLQLWRVRYPLSAIAAGGCVFAEYHGFISLDYDPPSFPGTPPDSLVSTIRLTPRTGGPTQTFTFTGPNSFKGGAPVGTPYPPPTQPWQPDLEAGRDYCVSISTIGYGDLARLPADSAELCASVISIDASTTPPTPPPQLGDDMVRTGGCTCAVAGGAGGGAAACGVGLVLAAITVSMRRRRLR